MLIFCKNSWALAFHKTVPATIIRNTRLVEPLFPCVLMGVSRRHWLFYVIMVGMITIKERHQCKHLLMIRVPYQLKHLPTIRPRLHKRMYSRMLPTSTSRVLSDCVRN